MKQHLTHKIFHLISDCIDEMQIDAWVIGGYVRDLLLNRPSKDIDVVVLGSGIELAKMISKKKGIAPPKVFKNFGTAMLRYEGLEIEFVGARKESYHRNSRKPFVENGTLEDDQNRRDFTINALALGLRKERFGELLDPFNGLKDLQHKIIRTPRDPDITFSDDPLRMMRAIRFATQLGFNIYPETYEAIKKNVYRLQIVSKERIIDELNKIVASRLPSRGFFMLLETGILQLILPEMVALTGAEYIEGKGHKDNFKHTLEVLDKLASNTDNLWLRWAAILHDIAKPITKKYDAENGWSFHAHEFVGAKMVPRIFRKLKLPMNENMKYVQKLVQLHLRPIALTEEVVTDSAIRRLLFEAGDDLEDLMMLCEADITSKNPVKVKRYLRNFKLVRAKLKEVEEKDKIRNWQPPISGDVIMRAFGIAPGREVGQIKNVIREAILDGEISNTFDQAFTLMLKAGHELGLKQMGQPGDFLHDKKQWMKNRENYKLDKEEMI